MRVRWISLAILIVLGWSLNAEPSKDTLPAIRRAVVALKQLQKPDGSWGQYGPGSTALAALALLESGVPPDDPAIVGASRLVRPEIVFSTHTYSLGLSILLLDRIADANDSFLIKVLADRLVAGQHADGGWSYVVPLGELHGLDKKYPGAKLTSGGSSMEGHKSDNSNTQFAILGIWTGRRYGADVDAALKKVDERFRNSFVRLIGGVGWGYLTGGTDTNGPRTCCALLGLGAYLGSTIDRQLKTMPGIPTKEAGANRPDPLRDPLIRDGLRYVLQEFTTEVAKVDDKPDFYFLWSVERTAMTYGLQGLFGVNWYRLGVLRLLPAQHPDGLWRGSYGPDVDTSFALLFLNRANLTKDLTGLLNPKQTSELRAEGQPTTPPRNEPAADRLVREFLSDEPENYGTRLEQYRDGKGVEFTEAIARIIPRVDAATQKTARDCLAARLARMTAATLRDRLKDANVELRRAACLACAMKEEKSMIGDLVAALDDKDTMVVRSAAVALAKLTGENFGPALNASDEDRAKAIAAWKKWWDRVQRG